MYLTGVMFDLYRTKTVMEEGLPVGRRGGGWIVDSEVSVRM